ncbi:DNA polymerase III subunit alpha [Emticicia fluvialis]|uniref:DNA polymerase III subunit alpha n=1 Tax=Emticicia fluvialis TaxID=2974474 RepID=UPI0021656569|nr:DNA polymerase III subunit alpha [Emticicia fluvialis]
MYINCHSYFSLSYGTLSIKSLVQRGKESGCKIMALTDINACSGVFDFVYECQQAGIKPLVGIEFRNGDDFKYIMLAANAAGFYEMNQFLTDYLETEKPFPTKAPESENVFTIYPLSHFNAGRDLRMGDNEYIGIRFWEINQLFRYKDHPVIHKVLAYHTLTFDDKTSHNVHRLLRAIGKNTLLSKLDKNIEANNHETFFTIPDLLDKFQNCKAFLRNTALVVNGCDFQFDYKTNKSKQVFTTSKPADMAMLRKLAYDGAENRYERITQEVKERIEKELAIIETLNFASYFLITWDILRFARSKGYFHVGRGSGANSIVAYCVEITDVDPIELNLFFERFINPERTSPPDFDLDFSWDERDEVIEYIFTRYGKDHVCLIATYNTYQKNSAVRELAKVFGLPKREIDDLIDYPEKVSTNPHVRYILKYAPLLIDLPHNLSIHAGGVLISELPIYHYTALLPMPKGFPVSMWDMYVAEDIGFPKFDILSQRGLGHIKMTVDIVRQNHQINIDIHQVQKFKKDENIKKQLQKNETMGCFYIESPAMRQLMNKLHVDNYLLLVAASSIIRPGVASSGMMGEFIRRHHNPHNISYLHPRMAELLSETYGVMIYQEDVLKVASGFANLSLSEADVLRRAMSGKYRSRVEFQKLVDKWFANCKEMGYPEELAKEVWRQVESFAGYSFSKAHSASYAVESYQSLFLKTYYPLEFMTAVINNQGGFYRAQYYFHEAKRWGAEVEVPEINESEYITTIQGKIIWMGFMHVKSLEYNLITEICRERKQGGVYRSFDDFVNRVNVDLQQLIILIRVGAFRRLGSSKIELLWTAHLLYHGRFKPITYKETLFEKIETPTYKLPVFSEDYKRIEDAYDEMELIGFSMLSPFELADEPISSNLGADDFQSLYNQNIRIYGYYVTNKTIRTKNKKLMAFGYFIDVYGKFFDTTHFPQVLEKQKFTGTGVYEIKGKVVEDFGFYSIEVHHMRKLPVKPDPRTVGNLEQTETIMLAE